MHDQRAHPLVRGLALAAAVAALPAIASAQSLRSIPNVTVAYYDVSGADVRAVHQALEQSAPRSPGTNMPVPATSDWSIKAKVDTRTTAGKCTITGATVMFSGTATLPRLRPANGAAIPPGLAAAWQSYSTQLEARQAAQLRFAYDRMAQVEQAIRASSCANWKAAASAATERLKKQQAQAVIAMPAPVLAIPKGELKKEKKRSG